MRPVKPAASRVPADSMSTQQPPSLGLLELSWPLSMESRSKYVEGAAQKAFSSGLCCNSGLTKPGDAIVTGELAKLDLENRQQ